MVFNTTPLRTLYIAFQAAKLYAKETVVGDVAGKRSRINGTWSDTCGGGRYGQLCRVSLGDGNKVKTGITNWPTARFTQYELGSVQTLLLARALCVVKRRTTMVRITDLEDESHPDRYSGAQYRAESQPDGIIAASAIRRPHYPFWFIDDWNIFSPLTGATTAGAALYVAQPSLMVQKVIRNIL